MSMSNHCMDIVPMLFYIAAMALPFLIILVLLKFFKLVHRKDSKYDKGIAQKINSKILATPRYEVLLLSVLVVALVYIDSPQIIKDILFTILILYFDMFSIRAYCRLRKYETHFTKGS
jgi:hypothetical protein